MNKAVFLDRDGTINVDRHYIHTKEEFEFLPGAVEALHILQQAGYILIIVTNQSGIARGYYTENDFMILNKWMIETLNHQGIKIDGVYYCPHLPDATIRKYKTICNCRKPQLGLFKTAIKEFNVDIACSYAIGDKIRDCSICIETECKGFLIDHNEKSEIIEAVKMEQYFNIRYAENLLEAARKIVGV